MVLSIDGWQLAIYLAAERAHRESKHSSRERKVYMPYGINRFTRYEKRPFLLCVQKKSIDYVVGTTQHNNQTQREQNREQANFSGGFGDRNDLMNITNPKPKL